MLDSLRDEVQRDPRFSVLIRWYDSVDIHTELMLEKLTGTRLELRSYLINHQLTMKYYFGYVLEELESNIKSEGSICENDDFSIILVSEFIFESFFRIQSIVDSAIRIGRLSKVNQLGVEESIIEFSNSFFGFIGLINNLADEVNKVKKEGYSIANPPSEDSMNQNL